MRTHFPTTHVAALVGERYLVKLHYEDWFGEDSFQTEREAYRMLSDHDLPVPELLAEGALYDEGWRWPFLVLTAMGGTSLRDVGDAATRATASGRRRGSGARSARSTASRSATASASAATSTST